MIRAPTRVGPPGRTDRRARWYAHAPEAATRLFALSLLLSFLVVAVPHAHADELRAHLAWDRPIGTMCPAASALEADVEELLGRAVFAPRDEADVLVSGVVEDLASGVLVRIDARDRQGAVLGSRELTAPAGECASLRRALGLVLAFLLEQDGLLQESAAERAVEPQVGVFVGLLSATLPRADIGVGLSVALDPLAALRLRVDASYWLPVIAENLRGVGASFQAARGGLSACPRLSPPAATVDLFFCAGVQLGALISAPRMLTGTAHQARLLVQPNLELAIAVRFARHASLEASVGALTNVLRPTFLYARGDGGDMFAHRPALVGAFLRAGLTID